MRSIVISLFAVLGFVLAIGLCSSDEINDDAEPENINPDINSWSSADLKFFYHKLKRQVYGEISDSANCVTNDIGYRFYFWVFSGQFFNPLKPYEHNGLCSNDCMNSWTSALMVNWMNDMFGILDDSSDSSDFNNKHHNNQSEMMEMEMKMEMRKRFFS